MLLNAPSREISLGGDQSLGQKFAARMVEGVKRVVNFVLQRGIDLAILFRGLADGGRCAEASLDKSMDVLGNIWDQMDMGVT